jgi:nitrate reductase gamma subunit
MTLAVYGILCLAILISAVGCVIRVVMYAKQPLHLRWELYPVPHEAPHRAAHGGSYFEEVDWWTKSHKPNLAGEVGAMVPEMLLLKALHEFNRPMWFRSFPFHFGLYLLIATVKLLVISALLLIFVPAWMAGPLGTVLHVAYLVTGVAGTVLAIVGALALMQARMTDPKLKISTVPGDFFNLIAFVAALGTLAAGYLARGPEDPGILAIVAGLLRFDTALSIPPVLGAGLILCGMLAAYIPYTHMSHFIGKYFTYHSVRWSDEVNLRGGRIEAKLMEYLTYRPTWSAAHMTADGKRTWADVATTNPWQQGEKK